MQSLKDVVPVRPKNFPVSTHEARPCSSTSTDYATIAKSVYVPPPPTRIIRPAPPVKVVEKPPPKVPNILNRKRAPTKSRTCTEEPSVKIQKVAEVAESSIKTRGSTSKPAPVIVRPQPPQFVRRDPVASEKYRKQLFVSIPKNNNANILSQPSSRRNRLSSTRDSKTFEASFSFDSDPSSPQSIDSPIYSPSDFPPRQPDFDYSSFNCGDVILVDRTDVNDGLRKAEIIHAYREFTSECKYYNGQLILLKPSAEKRCQNLSGKQTIYYVHYLKLDRRMDEWIDTHEVHSLVKRGCQTPMDTTSLPIAFDLEALDTTNAAQKTRSRKKKAEEFDHNEKKDSDLGATLARCEANHEKHTMLKNIDSVQVGINVIRCWYFSPYPPSIVTSRHVYVCEYCMVYFDTELFYRIHIATCDPKPPPGELIYYDPENSFAVYEVLGMNNRLYCESLCLLSKLFLDHKTLFFQVSTFYFYVICEVESDGTHHLVGHFSKENLTMNNLACIMVLPPYQRKGYGKFLIQLSYAFSTREGYIGTPEKPLSDLGKVSYRGYWWWLLVNIIEEEGYESDVSIAELERVSGIAADDIISTFEPVELVRKYKDEVGVAITPKVLEFCKSLSLFKSPKLLLDSDLIQWTNRYLPKSQTAREESHRYRQEEVKPGRTKPVVEAVAPIKAELQDEVKVKEVPDQEVLEEKNVKEEDPVENEDENLTEISDEASAEDDDESAVGSNDGDQDDEEDDSEGSSEAFSDDEEIDSDELYCSDSNDVVDLA